MALKGSRELQARMKAIKQAFKPIGRDWGEKTADNASRMVSRRTGRLARSFRVRNATQRRATVVGHFTANFEDAGAKPHSIRARRSGKLIFQSRGQTIFARRVNHPGRRARPFKVRAARQALDDTPMAQHLIDLWNKAG